MLDVADAEAGDCELSAKFGVQYDGVWGLFNNFAGQRSSFVPIRTSARQHYGPEGEGQASWERA